MLEPANPEMVETRILREIWEVDSRLIEIALTRKGLEDVAQIARMAASNATAFHPANASGTFSYQDGTWGLRNTFIGDDWRLDREGGVEAIWNESLRVRVIFANVDLACNDDHEPKPRSRKGAGAERACEGNLFGFLPTYSPRQADDEATYYLMVDERGRAELSRPVIKGGTFSSYVERLYLIIDGDDGRSVKLDLDDRDIADDFDPQVVRK